LKNSAIVCQKRDGAPRLGYAGRGMATEAPTGTDSWDVVWQGAIDDRPPDLDAPTLDNDIDRLKVEFLKPVLPQSGRALEVGCGSARLLARVGRAASLELFAVDSSPKALEVSQATAAMIGIPISARQGNADALPFDMGSFDVVLSGGLLEHFEDPRPILAEMVRVLRPGGVFYADVVPRKLSLFRIKDSLRLLTSPWMLPGVYESKLGEGYYRKVLTELGITDLVIESCGVYPPGASVATAHRTEKLNGSWLASLAGWYFMIRGRRG
jgi:SAM-dependent methyltransferase